MAYLNIFLYFEGNCEEAFLHYKNAFGGDFKYISRYTQCPEKDKIPQEYHDKIMHIELPISKETALKGSDWMTSDLNSDKKNSFSISVIAQSRDEADKLFIKLSAEGKVKQPMTDMFWGDYFGQFTDKFGVNWIILCSK